MARITRPEPGPYGGLMLPSDKPKAPSRYRSPEDLRWWTAPSETEHGTASDDVHAKVISLVRRIRDRQGFRRQMDLHHARMYSDMEMPGLGRRSYTPIRFNPSKLSLNVTKNCVDTLTAKITKARPLPMFLTSGGNWSQKRKAKLLTRFVEGAFDMAGVFDKAPAVVQDCNIFGTGFAKVYREEDVLRIERVPPWEMVVDEAESVYGEPRSIFQMKWVDRWMLCEMFPDHREAIESAASTPIDRYDQPIQDAASDQLLVVEGWHLRSSPNSEDGRHVIVVDGATLFDEPWERDYFPFAVLRRGPAVNGFWGIGVCQELTGIQYEINVTATKIQRSHLLMGGSMWMVADTAGVPSAHIDNGIGTIVRYKGPTPPQAVQTQPVHPETYQHLLNLYQKAYEVTGISALSARSEKPAGLNSGVALERYSDIESERFVVFGRNYEEWCMTIARQFVDLAREIAEEDPRWSVLAKRKGHLDSIVFREADLPEDHYVMQVFPTNMLAKTPAARLEQVQTLANAGWISPSEAKMLLDFPDLEGVVNRESASFRATEKAIENIIDHGKYTPPLGVMNLEEARNQALFAFLDAYQEDVPQERLDMLLEWSDACIELLNQKTASESAAPPPPDMGGAPPPMGPDGAPQALQGSLPPPGALPGAPVSA